LSQNTGQKRPTVAACHHLGSKSGHPGAVGQGDGVNKEPWVGLTLEITIGEAVLDLSGIKTTGSPFCEAFVELFRHHDTEVCRVENDSTVLLEEVVGVVEKAGETFEGSNQADAVHEEEDGVEALSSHRGEVSAARVRHPSLAHDLDRFGRYIDRGHFEPTTLEFERMPTGSSPEIQGPSPTQIEGSFLELREWLVIRAVELLDQSRFVDPEVRVNGDSRRGGAVVKVEEGPPEGPPAFSVAAGPVQGCGHGSRSRSTGAMTRMTGSRPTVSSQ